MAETYYSLTDIVKLCDNLVAAMPTSFYSGIMTVRTGLANIPAADVVARDCYDRLLAENDELRKERPVVRCKNCRHRDPEDHKCDSGQLERAGCVFPVDDDYFCAYGERPNCGARMDGDGE